MDSSPEDPPGGFGEMTSPPIDENSSPSSAAAGRSSARGFKKIFGRIKRSNSGGHLEDKVGRSETPEFRRGGFRATAGGRLAATPHKGNHPHHHHPHQHHQHQHHIPAGHVDKREEMTIR